MSHATFFTLPTDDGPFSVIYLADGSGQADSTEAAPVVLAAGWTSSRKDLAAQIHSRLRPEQIVDGEPDAVLAAAVEAYYHGDPVPVSHIAVRQASGPFRQHAWEVLRSIPAGKPLTYSEYAARTGSPAAVRAAASACASNAAALFVPCHRVLRQDGSLGGFRWGVQVKESLLKREREYAAASGDGAAD